MPRPPARERDGPGGRERECVACLEWLPLELFQVRNGFRMRACRECRRTTSSVALERYGETTTAPAEPAAMREVVAEREIRFWFRATRHRRTTITAARFYAGELHSTAELTVPTAERALRVALTWCAWVRVRGAPARFV